MSDINKLSISYSDFVLNTVIDPEHVDINNLEIVTKVNNLIDAHNGLTASKIGILPISGVTTTNLQTALEQIKSFIDIHNADTNNPHNITASDLGVYTKEELEPYLRGGDTMIKYEVFTIVNSNNGDGTFDYLDSEGITRHGTLTESGHQNFVLTKGSYIMGQNRIDCVINDTLQRSVASGGLIEVSSTSVTLTSPEGNGSEITFKYFEKIGVTGVGSGLIVISAFQPAVDNIWYKVLI